MIPVGFLIFLLIIFPEALGRNVIAPLLVATRREMARLENAEASKEAEPSKSGHFVLRAIFIAIASLVALAVCVVALSHFLLPH